MVNEDEMVELRDEVREEGSLPREEVGGRLLGRRKER
jgi:hypothetical protein